jgi:hypothetical protein
LGLRARLALPGQLVAPVAWVVLEAPVGLAGLAELEEPALRAQQE